MRIVIACALCVVVSLAHGEIYKLVQPDGTVVFSDKPQQGAEAVKLGPTSTYSPPTLKKPARPAQEASAKFRGYTKFSIVSPENDATFRDAEGGVPVSFTLEPELQPNNTIAIFMDGQPKAVGIASTSVTLNNINRGSHTLQAAIQDSSGKEIKRSGAVTIHMKRTTVFNQDSGPARPIVQP